jgi:hypothetical protein
MFPFPSVGVFMLQNLAVYCYGTSCEGKLQALAQKMGCWLFPSSPF